MLCYIKQVSKHEKMELKFLYFEGDNEVDQHAARVQYCIKIAYKKFAMHKKES